MSKLYGRHVDFIIIDDPMKPPTKKETPINPEKQALKLFAQGYRPLKNSAFPRIGMFDLRKIRQRYGIITPIVLMQCAGVSHYTINRKEISNEVFYALHRLISNAPIKIYEILCEQLNENAPNKRSS